MKSKIIITTILTMFATVGIIYSSSWLTNAAGDLNIISRNLVFGNTLQRLYGDGSSAIYADSNNSTLTQMIFRDKEDTQYGRVYGSGNGSDFGLLDGDGNWSYLAVKDNYTEFRINNSVKMKILANGNVQANKYCNFSGECISPGSSNVPEGTWCGYVKTKQMYSWAGDVPSTSQIRCNGHQIASEISYYRYSFSCPSGYFLRKEQYAANSCGADGRNTCRHYNYFCIKT